MWPDDNQLTTKKSIGFCKLFPKTDDDASDNLGGFLYNGKYGWLANRSLLQIVSTENGNKIATFNFDSMLRIKNAEITCVEEIQVEHWTTCLLAVGLQFPETGGLICILSVQGSRLLHAIDLFEKVTSCSFISTEHCARGVLQTWDSGLAIGTERGKIFVFELDLQVCKNVLLGTNVCVDISEVTQCHIAYANMTAQEIELQRRQAKEQSINFGVQLEVLGPVLSVLAVPTILTLATGLADGRMILYDLEDLQVFHIAFPPYENAPLTNFCIMEPTDDPRANLYIWSLHVSELGAIAVMHALIFERKFLEDNVYYYDTFNSCHVRLTMPMDDPGSVPLACQSISKMTNQDEEIIKLCQIAWTGKNKTTHTIIFDLNQWYKAQMPHICNWKQYPNYIAAFVVDDGSALNVSLNEASLVAFNSIQRPEEHFHPNSLCFDLNVLTNSECCHLNWPGLQQKILGMLTENGAYAILNPDEYFGETMAAVLIPQFYDFNVTKYSSIDEKREFLLSIALEYNCVNVLKQCAISWADGSHMGNNLPQGHVSGVALSTLTNWIWQRAKLLKETSNDLCVPLFDYSGQPIDYVIQKALSHCTRQLKILSDLFTMIVTTCRKYIPDHIFTTLETQAHSILIASEYQDVLQWLLNVGMLPEGLWRHDGEHHTSSNRRHLSNLIVDEQFISVPYPYYVINAYYKAQRVKLMAGERRDRRNTQTRPSLFIDEFINRELESAKELKQLWRANGGSSEYPPNSLQTMLRTLLIADITSEQKYILFVYLFLDIDSVMRDGRYSTIVQKLVKFPAVFKMNPATIKRTQAFWYFDHGHLETAVEELLSPLSNDHQHLAVWQRELLISTLLKHDAPHLALRILRSPGLQISATLELETLLANKLMSEAFKFQRSKNDKNLLIKFFECSIKSNVTTDLLLDFALTDEEEALFEEFLENSDLPLAENVHFVYLLQRSKFNQAVTLVDSLGKRHPSHAASSLYNLDIPKEVLSIFHSNLEPTTRHLTYLTYQNRDKFNQRKKTALPQPLSSKLFDQRQDVNRAAGNVFQKSILSVKEAGDEVNMEPSGGDFNVPFIRRPGLGIFSSALQAKTQSNNNVVYPIVIQQKQNKRKLNQELRSVQGHDQLDATQQDVFTFNELHGPTKRRRVLEHPTDKQSFSSRKSLKDINPKILTVFQERKPTFNFTQQQSLHPESLDGIDAQLEKTPEKLTTNEITLRTPVVARRQPIDRNVSPASTISRYTPQSILKIHSRRQTSVSPAPTEMSSRVSTIDNDEKAIRFNLPSANTTMMGDYTGVSLEISSAIENNNSMDSMENDDRLDSEVLDGSLLSSQFKSDDEYYSPETSRRDAGDSVLKSGSFTRPSIHNLSASETQQQATPTITQEIFGSSFSRKELPTDVVDEEMNVSVGPDEPSTPVQFEAQEEELPEQTEETIECESVTATPPHVFILETEATATEPDVTAEATYQLASTKEKKLEITYQKTESTTTESTTTEKTTINIFKHTEHRATTPENVPSITQIVTASGKKGTVTMFRSHQAYDDEDSSQSEPAGLFNFEKNPKTVQIEFSVAEKKVPAEDQEAETPQQSAPVSDSSDSSPMPSPIKKDGNILQDDSMVDGKYVRQWKENSLDTTNTSANDTSVFERHTILEDTDTTGGANKTEEEESSGDSENDSDSYDESEDEPAEEFDTDDEEIVKYYDNNPLTGDLNVTDELDAEEEEDEDDDEDDGDIVKYYEHEEIDEAAGAPQVDEESDFSEASSSSQSMSEEAAKILNKSEEVIDILDSSEDGDDNQQNEELKEMSAQPISTIEKSIYDEDTKSNDMNKAIVERSIYDEDTKSNDMNKAMLFINPMALEMKVAATSTKTDDEQCSSMLYDNMEVEDEMNYEQEEDYDVENLLNYAQVCEKEEPENSSAQQTLQGTEPTVAVEQEPEVQSETTDILNEAALDISLRSTQSLYLSADGVDLGIIPSERDDFIQEGLQLVVSDEEVDHEPKIVATAEVKSDSALKSEVVVVDLPKNDSVEEALPSSASAMDVQKEQSSAEQESVAVAAQKEIIVDAPNVAIAESNDFVVPFVTQEEEVVVDTPVEAKDDSGDSVVEVQQALSSDIQQQQQEIEVAILAQEEDQQTKDVVIESIKPAEIEADSAMEVQEELPKEKQEAVAVTAQEFVVELTTSADEKALLSSDSAMKVQEAPSSEIEQTQATVSVVAQEKVEQNQAVVIDTPDTPAGIEAEKEAPLTSDSTKEVQKTVVVTTQEIVVEVAEPTTPADQAPLLSSSEMQVQEALPSDIMNSPIVEQPSEDAVLLAVVQEDREIELAVKEATSTDDAKQPKVVETPELRAEEMVVSEGVEVVSESQAAAEQPPQSSLPDEEKAEKTPEVSPTPEKQQPALNLRKTRARSQSIDTQPSALDSPSIKRILRGKSIPKAVDSEIVTPQKRTRRSGSVEASGKQKSSKKALEVIEEDSAQQSTPARNTRRRSSVDTPDYSATPKRVTRRSSTHTPIKEIEDVADTKTLEINDTTTPRKRGRKRSTSVHEDDDAKSEKSSSSRTLRRRLQSIQSPEVPPIAEEEPSQSPKTPNLDITPPDEYMESYSQSRRLTRSQIQVMNKSAEVSRRAAESSGHWLRARSISSAHEPDDGNVSDSSSVASNKTRTSNVSLSPSMRSAARQKRKSVADDTESIASSTRSKTKGEHFSPGTPSKNLTVIQEERSDDDSSVADLVIDEDPPKRKKSKRLLSKE